jgi:multimeric flavodoxin WrbA
MLQHVRRVCSPPARKTLLLVWHSRTGLAEQMAGALERGAYHTAKEMDVEEHFAVRRRKASDATTQDLLEADGYLFCAPENLASTSGQMLEFFHRSYYHMFAVDPGGGAGSYSETSRLLGRPVGVAVAAGSDGTSAARQMERICRGWRLVPVAEALIHNNGQPQTAEAILAAKTCTPEAQARCHELGGLVAATILLNEGG